MKIKEENITESFSPFPTTQDLRDVEKYSPNEEILKTKRKPRNNIRIILLSSYPGDEIITICMTKIHVSQAKMKYNERRQIIFTLPPTTSWQVTIFYLSK